MATFGLRYYAQLRSKYKGHPLMRKDNLIYYGSMADAYIVMLQVLESKKVGDTDIATRVSVQLQLTDPAARSRDRVVKKSEKDGLYTALDVGCVWLDTLPAIRYSPALSRPSTLSLSSFCSYFMPIRSNRSK